MEKDGAFFSLNNNLAPTCNLKHGSLKMNLCTLVKIRSSLGDVEGNAVRMEAWLVWAAPGATYRRG